jgi:hypothetical protein
MTISYSKELCIIFSTWYKRLNYIKKSVGFLLILFIQNMELGSGIILNVELMCEKKMGK